MVQANKNQTSIERNEKRHSIMAVLLLVSMVFMLGLSGCEDTGVDRSKHPAKDAEETDLPTDNEAVTNEPNPADDVLNHYSNLFIVSNVNSCLNLRDCPSPKGEIIATIAKNGGGEILEDLGGWYRVRSGGIEGYVASEYCVSGKKARTLAPSAAVRMVYSTVQHLNVRSGPSLDFGVLTQIGPRDHLQVEGDLGEWYRISFNGRPGYISKKYTSVGWYLIEAVGFRISAKRQNLLHYAEQFIGIPYKMGGTSLSGGGIDCSSFVQQCLKNALDINFDRNSWQLADRGCKVRLSDAKPGDLMFYADEDGTINHVAFYMGDEKILHASQTFGKVAISAYNYASEPIQIKNVIGD